VVLFQGCLVLLFLLLEINETSAAGFHFDGRKEPIQSSLRATSGVEVQVSKIKWTSLNIWQLAGAFSLLALISISGWQWTAPLRAPSSAQRIAAEVFSNHVRSLEGNAIVVGSDYDSGTRGGLEAL
jgi:hypothetical protein